MKRILFLIFPLALIVSCKGDVIEPPTATLAPRFTMTASASGGDSEGRTAECSLRWEFELRSESARGDQFIEYRGVHGGEISRTVLDRNGNGFGFFIDVYGEVIARVYSPNLIEFEIPVNATADSRLYRSLSRIYGVANDRGYGSGTWTCSPLDLDQGGYSDTLLTVEGTFQITPHD